jgi:hypothetical protein
LAFVSPFQLGGALLGAGLLAGCPAVSSDPPPPTTKPEIVVAPPRALGAMAAGTDAAPLPDRKLGSSDVTPPLPVPHGGAVPVPDGGPPDPGQEGGVTPAPPDAGMAL